MQDSHAPRPADAMPKVRGQHEQALTWLSDLMLLLNSWMRYWCSSGAERCVRVRSSSLASLESFSRKQGGALLCAVPLRKVLTERDSLRRADAVCAAARELLCCVSRLRSCASVLVRRMSFNSCEGSWGRGVVGSWLMVRAVAGAHLANAYGHTLLV
jgi:hypothetical protein